MNLDINVWLWSHFGDVVTYGSPVTDLRVNCPFCESRYGKVDNEHKLYIGVEIRTCHCFRCEYSRSWDGLVMDVTGMDYTHALGELYKPPKAKQCDELESMIELATRPRSVVVALPGHFTFPKGFIALASDKCCNRLLKYARGYMYRRGFSKECLGRYSLGISPSYPMRVIIPIEGPFYQARAIYPFMEPKYIHPKMESRHYLFNSVALELYDEVVICEGAFSAMAISENAIAVIGNKASDEQITRLVGSPVERFIVALDADARVLAVELSRRLKRGGKAVTIWQYEEGDPADGGEYISKDYGLRAEVEARLL